MCLFVLKKNKKLNTVIIRLDSIGDFILWLDTAKEYSKIFSTDEIILVANSSWAEYAKEFPYWNKVWPIDIIKFGRNPLYRWKFLRKIRKYQFANAIQPVYSRSFMYGDSLIRATNAYKRIGSTTDLTNISFNLKKISDKWYTKLIKVSDKKKTEIERNAEFISNLSGRKHKTKLPKLIISKDQHPDLKKIKKYFIIFPGASWKGRRWPENYFSEILNYLHQSCGWTAVMCGSDSDWKMCELIINNNNGSAINLAGKTSLLQLITIIDNSELIISNETSALHIATILGTPAVGIIGGGHYGRFFPYPKEIQNDTTELAICRMNCFGCNWKCIKEHNKNEPVPCISSITPKQVILLSEKVLKKY